MRFKRPVDSVFLDDIHSLSPVVSPLCLRILPAGVALTPGKRKAETRRRTSKGDIKMEENMKRGTSFKLGILWVAILLLGKFWLTVRAASGQVSMTGIPQAPREGEPV